MNKHSLSIAAFALLLFLIFSNSKSCYAGQTFTPFPSDAAVKDSSARIEPVKIRNLFEDITEPLLDNKWAGSCAFEHVANKDNVQDIVGKNYFFFSLSQFFDKKQSLNPHMNFFKTKDFTGSPAYVLDKEGFKEGTKTICSWSGEYSENELFKSSLSLCEMQKFLGSFFYITKAYREDDWTTYCKVVFVDKYEVDDLGIYSYQVKIGNQNYFIDTTHMPDLKNGNLFTTNEKREKTLYGRKSSEAESIVQSFLMMKNSVGFKKLFGCYANKDRECVLGMISSEFISLLAIVVGEGEESICPREGEKSKCITEKKAELENLVMYYVKDFIDSISLMKIENIMKSDSVLVPNQKNYLKVRMKPNTQHVQMLDPVYDVELKEGSLNFMIFYDGSTC